MKKTFQYVKTVEVDFSDTISMMTITDTIIDMLTDSLDREIWDDNEQTEIFETIKKEAYRYVIEKLNKEVE